LLKRAQRGSRGERLSLTAHGTKREANAQKTLACLSLACLSRVAACRCYCCINGGGRCHTPHLRRTPSRSHQRNVASPGLVSSLGFAGFFIGFWRQFFDFPTAIARRRACTTRSTRSCRAHPILGRRMLPVTICDAVGSSSRSRRPLQVGVGRDVQRLLKGRERGGGVRWRVLQQQRGSPLCVHGADGGFHLEPGASITARRNQCGSFLRPRTIRFHPCPP
jgi:hypothetical protein